MPDHLDEATITRSLFPSVRRHFYKLYNDDDSDFKAHLASVSNADSLTMNRLFDRKNAVDMIVESAREDEDALVHSAPAGLIYKHVNTLMRKNNLGLKLRRAEYARLTHQAA